MTKISFRNNLDRETGKLTRGFMPRYTQHGAVSEVAA